MEISKNHKKIIQKWHLSLGRKLRFIYTRKESNNPCVVEATILSMAFSPGVVVVGIHVIIDYAKQQKLESLLFTETDVLIGPEYEAVVTFS